MIVFLRMIIDHSLLENLVRSIQQLIYREMPPKGVGRSDPIFFFESLFQPEKIVFYTASYIPLVRNKQTHITQKSWNLFFRISLLTLIPVSFLAFFSCYLKWESEDGSRADLGTSLLQPKGKTMRWDPHQWRATVKNEESHLEGGRQRQESMWCVFCTTGVMLTPYIVV